MEPANNEPTRRCAVRRRVAKAIVWGAMCALAAPVAWAQDDAWPARTIRIVVPSAPGSSTDYLARALGQYVGSQTKQAVVVENKPGGNTIVASATVKNSPADGYTFLLSSVSSHSVNPNLYTRLPYNPAKDFAEVGNFTSFPYIVVARKESPYRSLDDILAAARQAPGRIRCGYSALASRVPCELIKRQARVDMIAVSYKAAPNVLNDLAAGTIEFTVMDAMSASAGIQGGLVRAIAVTSTRPIAAFPNLKTVAQTLPGYEYQGWAGLSAPAGTPSPVLDRMNRYMREALAQPALRNYIESTGASVVTHSPAEQTAFVAADEKRWQAWVQAASIPRMD